MCEPDRSKTSIILSFILCIPPSCSFSPLSSGLSSLKAFLFISNAEGGAGLEDGSLVERVGQSWGGWCPMFALSYWFHVCLEVNGTLHLMTLSQMSNKNMKGRVA